MSSNCLWNMPQLSHQYTMHQNTDTLSVWCILLFFFLSRVLDLRLGCVVVEWSTTRAHVWGTSIADTCRFHQQGLETIVDVWVVDWDGGLHDRYFVQHDLFVLFFTNLNHLKPKLFKVMSLLVMILSPINMCEELLWTNNNILDYEVLWFWCSPSTNLCQKQVSPCHYVKEFQAQFNSLRPRDAYMCW